MKNSLEEIYPLTIINPRFGDQFIILNCTSDFDLLSKIEDDEEISYDYESYLERNLLSYEIKFGIGYSIIEAFIDYQKRNYEVDGYVYLDHQKICFKSV